MSGRPEALWDLTPLLLRAQSGEAPAVLEELGPLFDVALADRNRESAQWLRLVRFVAFHERRVLDRADATAAEIVEAAEAMDDRNWVALGRALRGSALQQQGHFESAFEQLASSIALLEDVSPTNALFGHVVNAAVVSLVRLDLYELASQWLARIYPLAVEHDDPTLQALYAVNSGLLSLAWAFDLELIDDRGTAREHYRQTLSALDRVPSSIVSSMGPVWASEVAVEAATARAMLGETHEHLVEELTTNLTMLSERHRHQVSLIGHLGLSRVHAGRGDLDTAVKEAEQACRYVEHLPRFQVLAGRAYWEYAELLERRDGGSTAATAFSQLARRLIHDRWLERRARVESFEQRLDQERTRDEMRRRAAAYLTDSLTGLGNRRLVEIRLPEMLVDAAARGGSLVVAFVDVDDFKSVNDELSHLIGDELLCELAQEMRAAMRADDIIARFGGEEFVLVLPGRTAREGYAELEGLRARVEGRSWTCLAADHRGIRVTIGMVESWEGATRTQLLASADEALLSAKRDGKNQVKVRARPLLDG